ncbi:hypothetical protein PG999_012428 [Apiospora kogelbergensis]|uniref:N-acetyltransferase domain-containing protein n=1 Tax=Apiospora kogelbergensis TaxID=1337665 RepID=A0AAW0Q9R8_9PEZI
MPPLPPPVADTHGVELPPRYRICLLTEEYTDWIKALYSDGFLLRCTPWVAFSRAVPPGSSRRRLALRAFTELDAFHRYLVTSGLSYAIFDTEYMFERPGSAAAGGHLYWEDDGLATIGEEVEDEDAEVKRMIDGMDFPLVCHALSYDGFAPPPAEVQEAVAEFYPLRGPVFTYISQHLDTRPADHPDRQAPTEPNQVLMRHGCITKRGYEGRGLMTALNRFVALEARARGFRGLSVGTNSPTVMRSYFFDNEDEGEKRRNPMAAAGMRSFVFAHVEDLCKYSLKDIGVEAEDGKEGAEVYPLRGHNLQRQVWLIWCDLAPPALLLL